MAIQIVERTPSRGGTVSNESPSAHWDFTVFDIDGDGVTNPGLSEGAVRVVVEATVPAFFRGLPFTSYTLEHVGAGVYEIEATYSRRTPRKPGTITIEFDTTAETANVKNSLAHLYFVAPGDPVIDFQGAINVKRSGGTVSVDGVDVKFPKFAFTLKRTYGPPEAPLTGAQIQAFYQFTGHNNADAIARTIAGIDFVFEAGTLLFEGVTGFQTTSGGNQFGQVNPPDAEDGDSWEISVRWAYSPNVRGLTIGNIPNIDKNGWEYLWVSYIEQQDTTSNQLVQIPRQVCVEQVYPLANLGGLFT